MFGGQNVAGDQRDARVVAESFAQQFLKTVVDLDRDHTHAALEQQFRERSGAGPDLQHDIAGPKVCRVNQFSHKIQVDQEVLAEAVPRRKAVGGEQAADIRKRLAGHSPDGAEPTTARQEDRHEEPARMAFGRKKRLTDYANCAG